MWDLVIYKHKCDDGGDAIALIEKENDLIVNDVQVACRNDSIYVALLNLKMLTKKLPLKERLCLFFKLLDLMNFRPSDVAPYADLYQLLVYYLL
jgi:hypothetical protein